MGHDQFRNHSRGILTITRGILTITRKNHRLGKVFLGLVALSWQCFWVVAQAGPQVPPAWPMFRHDAQRTGQSPFVGPQQVSAPKWTFTLDPPSPIESSPSIGPDGTIYFGALNGVIYALRPDGTLKWKWPTGNFSWIDSSPAVTSDGLIIFGTGVRETASNDGEKSAIWVLKDQGSYPQFLLRKNGLGPPFEASPLITPSGLVVIGSQDTFLYALSLELRSFAWIYQGILGPINSSPAMGPDGTLYVGSQDGHLHAITPTGEKKWAFPTGGWIESTPVVDSEGVVYFGSLDGKVYAVRPDGTPKWAYSLNKPGEPPVAIYSSPALGKDGTLYVGAENGKLYALRTDGTLKWIFPPQGNLGPIFSSPCVGADGTVYFGSDDFNIYAVGPDGKEKWRYPTGSFVTSSPAIAPDGTLYVGSTDGKLYAFAGPGTSFLYGDVNQNGRVEVADVILVLGFVIGLREPTDLQKKAADVYPKNPETGAVGDGRITIIDALKILRRILSLEPDPWP